MSEQAFNRPALEQLLGKRFFYAPAFSLYGGNMSLSSSIIG
jgi:glycyl-tRNA synthetase